jgi:hypothetical protein
MSAVPEEYKEEIRNARAQLSAARSATRPQRPPTKSNSKPTVQNLNKVDDSEISAPKIVYEDRKKGIALTNSEQKELLKDAHSDIRPNIVSDDLMK